MKNVIMAAIAAVFSTSVMAAQPDQDWDFSEQDYVLNYAATGTSVTYRNIAGSDYEHVELGQRLKFDVLGFDLSRAEVLYRYTETDADTTERRYTGRYDIWHCDTLGLTITPEVAYNVVEDAQDYTRLSVIAEFRKPVPGLANTQAFLRVKPRWYLGEGQKEDFETDDGRYQLGVDYKWNKLTVGGFVEYNTASGQDKEFWMTGTRVAYNF
jgi:hypothetical protein